MKHLTRIVLCLVLAISMLAMCACGGDNTFEGNFSKEATEADLTAFVEGVDTNKLVADQNNLGAELSVNLDVINNTSFGVYSVNTSGNINASAKLAFSAPAEGAEMPNIKAEITFGMDAESKAQAQGQSQTAKEDLSANVFFDNTGLYLKATMNSNKTGKDVKNEIKGKLDMETIMGMVSGMMPMAAGEGSEMGGTINLGTLLAGLKELGAKIYIDSSDGYKVKVSMSADAVKEIVDNPALNVNLFDYFLTNNKEGRLVGLKLSLDIGTTSSNQTVGVKGDLVLKINNVSINTPSDLASYEDLDMSELGGLLG